MNDLDIIVATLRGAIDSLESRKAPLTPIEKVKLKSLTLNLEAAELSMATPRTTAIPQAWQPGEQVGDPVEDKLRSLQALSKKTSDENSSLLIEMRAQITRARSLSDAVLQAVVLTERTSMQISSSIRTPDAQAHSAS